MFGLASDVSMNTRVIEQSSSAGDSNTAPKTENSRAFGSVHLNMPHLESEEDAKSTEPRQPFAAVGMTASAAASARRLDAPPTPLFRPLQSPQASPPLSSRYHAVRALFRFNKALAAEFSLSDDALYDYGSIEIRIRDAMGAVEEIDQALLRGYKSHAYVVCRAWGYATSARPEGSESSFTSFLCEIEPSMLLVRLARCFHGRAQIYRGLKWATADAINRTTSEFAALASRCHQEDLSLQWHIEDVETSRPPGASASSDVKRAGLDHPLSPGVFAVHQSDGNRAVARETAGMQMLHAMIHQACASSRARPAEIPLSSEYPHYDGDPLLPSTLSALSALFPRVGVINAKALLQSIVKGDSRLRAMFAHIVSLEDARTLVTRNVGVSENAKKLVEADLESVASSFVAAVQSIDLL
jgi:hypothetical protein